MTLTRDQREIPVAEGALALGWTRERVIRAIQTRALAGGLRGGRWYVSRRAVERELERRAADSHLPPAA